MRVVRRRGATRAVQRLQQLAGQDGLLGIACRVQAGGVHGAAKRSPVERRLAVVTGPVLQERVEFSAGLDRADRTTEVAADRAGEVPPLVDGHREVLDHDSGAATLMELGPDLRRRDGPGTLEERIVDHTPSLRKRSASSASSAPHLAARWMTPSGVIRAGVYAPHFVGGASSAPSSNSAGHHAGSHPGRDADSSV